jgi:hypothetical protein
VCAATGVAETLLGLPGFRVLEVSETAAGVVAHIETTAGQAGCQECRVLASAHDQMPVKYRDWRCPAAPHGWGVPVAAHGEF